MQIKCMNVLLVSRAFGLQGLQAICWVRVGQAVVLPPVRCHPSGSPPMARTNMLQPIQLEPINQTYQEVTITLQGF